MGKTKGLSLSAYSAIRNRERVFGDQRLAYACFILLMFGLGSSDSLKGIFSSIFQAHFGLTTARLSWIVSVSYLGNLVFLLAGGRLGDKYPSRTLLLGATGVWLGALLLFILTDNYYCLLVGMFLAMGSSTLINTTLNLVTPALFYASPGLAVNFLFFIQGVGTSGSQSLLGHQAADFFAWKLTNGVLFGIGFLASMMIWMVKIPAVPVAGRAGRGFGELVQNKAFVLLVFIFGLYFVAEHGILNWLVVYGVNALGLSTGKASGYLAIFFGGITVGRLVLAPLVDKFGAFQCIRWLSLIAAIMYITGIGLGERVILLLSVSGFFMAIIYPTLVMLIAKFFPPGRISTVTGMVISAASIFDILFNMGFGVLIDRVGYRQSFLMLPLAMALYVILVLGLAASVRQD